MSLSTGSWDFIYTSYSGSVSKSFQVDTLFKGLNIQYDQNSLIIDTSTVTFSIHSDESKIVLDVICKGRSRKLSSEEHVDLPSELKLKFTMLIDWVNKKNTHPINTSELEVEVSSNPVPTTLTDDDIIHFFNLSHSTTNTISVVPPKNPFYAFFLKLNFFQEWMNASIVRIGRKSNPYYTEPNKQHYISFCYMISKKDKTGIELAFNNDPAYVDLNAIPQGATSALVIERSVFGEHMVKAAFGKVENNQEIEIPDPDDASKTTKGTGKTFSGHLFKGSVADADLEKAHFSSHKPLFRLLIKS
jgi:hypothetical protein